MSSGILSTLGKVLYILATSPQSSATGSGAHQRAVSFEPAKVSVRPATFTGDVSPLSLDDIAGSPADNANAKPLDTALLKQKLMELYKKQLWDEDTKRDAEANSTTCVGHWYNDNSEIPALTSGTSIESINSLETPSSSAHQSGSKDTADGVSADSFEFGDDDEEEESWTTPLRIKAPELFVFRRKREIVNHLIYDDDGVLLVKDDKWVKVTDDAEKKNETDATTRVVESAATPATAIPTINIEAADDPHTASPAFKVNHDTLVAPDVCDFGVAVSETAGATTIPALNMPDISTASARLDFDNYKSGIIEKRTKIMLGEAWFKAGHSKE